jgi:uncharacterized coiled-coil DUF342 family protein
MIHHAPLILIIQYSLISMSIHFAWEFAKWIKQYREDAAKTNAAFGATKELWNAATMHCRKLDEEFAELLKQQMQQVGMIDELREQRDVLSSDLSDAEKKIDQLEKEHEKNVQAINQLRESFNS